MDQKFPVMIELQENSSIPMYIQIYEQLKQAIRKGSLKEGQRLPAIRRMSKELRVNTVTIVNAYRKLEQDGLITTKAGSGTYIQGVSGTEPDKQSFSPLSNLDGLYEGYVGMEDQSINFATSTPSPQLFPVEDFKRLINVVLDRDGGFALGYQEGQGYFPLRSAIVSYLKQWNIVSDESQIHITTGAQQGIDILSKTFLNYGDPVFIERPSYGGAISAFRSRGARIVDIPVEEDGINMAFLEDALRKEVPKFLYLMPNFQSPTGITYSLQKRKALLELSQRYGFYIVEDDYLRELNYTHKDTTPIKSLGPFHQVIYVKSFSKILMPGLRLGFIVVPSQYAQNIIRTKHSTDISTSSLHQRVLELYLKEDIWQNHIQHMTAVYQSRYQKMLSVMKEVFPPYIQYSEPGGGLVLWCKMPRGNDTAALYKICAESGIFITPGEIFFAANPQKNYLRLSFADVEESDIEKSLPVLAAKIRSMESRSQGAYRSPLL